MSSLSGCFFGHNYWQWCPSWGDLVSGTESQVRELNIALLRFGGMQADLGHPDKLINGYMAKFNRYAQKIGAQPLLQVQIAGQKTTDERIAIALDMISYFKTIGGLKHVSIGNEPDIYASNLATNPEYRAGHCADYGVADYCRDFNAVASAIKKQFPDIIITGLEHSWNRDGWVPDFVAKCKDNMDMISIHYYPLTAGQCTYERVRRQYDEIVDFYRQTRLLIDKNAQGKTLPLVIGETNITWDGDPKKSIHDASPGTFAAGLWFADFIGVSSSQNGLFSIMPWGIREGWKLGFIASRKNPIFFTYKLFSDYIKPICVHCEKVNDHVRVYAYKDSADNVSIFTVNWDTTNNYRVRFAFSGILNDSNHTVALPPFSLSCTTISQDMKNIATYLYTKRCAVGGPLPHTSPRFKGLFKKKKKNRFFRVKPL